MADSPNTTIPSTSRPGRRDFLFVGTKAAAGLAASVAALTVAGVAQVEARADQKLIALYHEYCRAERVALDSSTTVDAVMTASPQKKAEAERHRDEAWAKLGNIEEVISKTPAESIVGVLAKLLTWKMFDNTDFDQSHISPDQEFILYVIEDLKRLVGEEVVS